MMYHRTGSATIFRPSPLHDPRAGMPASLAARSLLVIACLGLGAACGARDGGIVAQPTTLPVPQGPVALDQAPPYFVAGESMTWEVTFLGVTGGRARLAVGAPGMIDGHRVIEVVAQAESAGVLAAIKRMRDSVESRIDLASGLPTLTESEVELKDKTLAVSATRRVGEAIVDLVVRRGVGRVVRSTRTLPAIATHDPVSAILRLRGFRAPEGTRAVFHTLGGLRVWQTELLVAGVEDIDGPLGKRAALKMTGISRRMTGPHLDAKHKPRSFTVWLSDDDARVPLRIEAHTELGDIVVTATSHEVPLLSRR